jgi:hypothetical protein
VWRASLPAVVLLSGLPVPGLAASSLRIPEPSGFGALEAATLDTSGTPLGPARMALERDPRGRIVVESESGIAGAESVRLYALLDPIEGSAELRLVEQRSQTLDAEGRVLVGLTVDHELGRATCTAKDGAERSLALPRADRVANVPLSLVLLPVARGERERVEFQVLLCRGAPRLLDVSAGRTGRVVATAPGSEAVEIEYRVELGPILARLARPFLPRILFWIDPRSPDPWVAHRMPLFPKGPTVLVVRRDLSPEPFLGE